ncbi:hypothetical protein Poly24_48840 [Rosistilla carotiformis]|uniref:Nickel uptake substrate-specific transmembrane region n=1 Tax=Rosistilla carotiformis TaxID=2528017 RepID=A0A518K033_9BACT|nr:carboxypeptidase-like regulatory domain-containing protein [Rosistilla carotiformis]QDV71150.1 hypothetical protein Poly24_48840 [Rosistilla carotiformis]
MMLFYSARPLLNVLWAAPLICLVGCGGPTSDRWTRDRPPVYHVSGQVLLNGEPLDQATVIFQPVGPEGKPGTAVTDADGRFEVQTFDPGDGLTEGTHRVAIKKSGMVDKAGNIVAEVGEPGSVTEKNFVPTQYSDFEKSGIEIVVTASDDNELEPFQLKD